MTSIPANPAEGGKVVGGDSKTMSGGDPPGRAAQRETSSRCRGCGKVRIIEQAYAHGHAGSLRTRQ
jgi:hypothetical protein